MSGSVTAKGALAEFGENVGMAVGLHVCARSLIVGIVGTAFVVTLGGDTALPLILYIAILASVSFVWVSAAAKRSALKN